MYRRPKYRRLWGSEFNLPNARLEFRPFSFYFAIPLFRWGGLRAYAGANFKHPGLQVWKFSDPHLYDWGEI